MPENAYVLRVKTVLARGVWREIAILGTHTLQDLHYAILDAFEWGEANTYAFYMNNDLGDMQHAYMPDQDTHHPAAVILDYFGLDEGDEFLYIFGDNDRNQFPIRVMILDNPDRSTDYPDVVDEAGDSPDQSFAY